MEKLRIWPMFASALVALILTLTLTSQHTIARGIGFGIVILGVAMAVSGFGEYPQKSIDDKPQQ